MDEVRESSTRLEAVENMAVEDRKKASCRKCPNEVAGMRNKVYCHIGCEHTWSPRKGIKVDG
jgi:cell fate regulator YaaT (PSP1 superfamily)